MEEKYTGVGRSDRRRMIRKWKAETGGRISLKQWARDQPPVGDIAYAWIKSKQPNSEQLPS